jgi:hypothetical protein
LITQTSLPPNLTPYKLPIAESWGEQSEDKTGGFENPFHQFIKALGNHVKPYTEDPADIDLEEADTASLKVQAECHLQYLFEIPSVEDFDAAKAQVTKIPLLGDLSKTS